MGIYGYTSLPYLQQLQDYSVRLCVNGSTYHTKNGISGIIYTHKISYSRHRIDYVYIQEYRNTNEYRDDNRQGGQGII